MPDKYPRQVLKGVPAAPGKSLGQVHKIQPILLAYTTITNANPIEEDARLTDARQQAREGIRRIKQDAIRNTTEEQAAVFDAHLLFLDDSALLKLVNEKILTGYNAEPAWMDGIEFFAGQMEGIPDPLFAARAADIRDVGRRVLAHLLGVDVDGGLVFPSPCIITARDLAPSQTVSLNKDLVLGFCLAEGGPTAHTAILARGLGIPAVTGLGEAILKVADGATIIMDGDSGEVIINPSASELREAESSIAELRSRQEAARHAARTPAQTRDGDRVEVAANIGNEEDAVRAIQYGAEGVGLFRTEFLYLNRQSMPGEEEQVVAYKKVFAPLKGLPVVVRTMDIGGDKAVSYLGITEEPNPFLGWRAIRMLDERADVIRMQCRALLRAGIEVNLRIMFPMVSNLEEVITLRQLLMEVKTELEQSGEAHARQYQMGIMVEVPSAALNAEHLAPLVDFFSIGTNDLTQYTLAVDRGNPRVAHLASPYHPSVLKLIQMTIEAAHKHGKWVGLCGELAGDVPATALLLGLGLDEFSMAPARIPEVKARIGTLSRRECQTLAEDVLQLGTTQSVLDRIQQ
jgi:phosphoenolpyruvate-protein phosphotransferase